MFDQLKGLKQVMSMLGNPEELKEKAQQMQQELASMQVTGDAGAGAVRVTVNGQMEAIRVEMDRAMIITLAGEGQDADQAMIEELVLAATNDALAKAREMAKEEMSKLTGGMSLPGLGELM